MAWRFLGSKAPLTVQLRQNDILSHLCDDVGQGTILAKKDSYDYSQSTLVTWANYNVDL